jgi:hypothetical protein
MTASAARFIRSRARLSLGFSKLYRAENLGRETGSFGLISSTYLWNPLPSNRTTIQVFGRILSDCSNARTYSYLELNISTS